jgi:leucyl/phenylalanyl-tRNA---protein transferase
MHGSLRLTPEILLGAYAEGLFPMAERRGDPNLYWISPEARGIIPLDGFHVSRRLARTVRSERFEVRIDTAFDAVIRACAAPGPGRSESWINDQIVSLYTALHGRGAAHSVECWRDGKLAGGLYGVTLGAAFFGESMFSLERDASKVALAHLAARLIAGGFRLLDAQFLTAHLARFGAIEIPRRAYLARLQDALSHDAEFYCPEPSGSSTFSSMAPALGETALTASVGATGGASWPGWLVLQLITETS